MAHFTKCSSSTHTIFIQNLLSMSLTFTSNVFKTFQKSSISFKHCWLNFKTVKIFNSKKKSIQIPRGKFWQAHFYWFSNFDAICWLKGSTLIWLSRNEKRLVRYGDISLVKINVQENMTIRILNAFFQLTQTM